MTRPQQVELTASGRQLQRALDALAEQGAVGLERAYQAVKDADEALVRKALGQVFKVVLGRVSTASAQLASQWYTELDPRTAFRASPVPDFDPGYGDRQTAWTMQALYDKAVDADPAARLRSTATEQAYRSARATIFDATEREGVRWARLAHPDCCDLCWTLTTRGAVYRSMSTASFWLHDYCRCIALPMRRGTRYTAPKYDGSVRR